MSRRGGKYPAKNILHHKHYLEYTLAQEKIFYAVQNGTIAAHTRNETGNILKDLLHFTFVVRSLCILFHTILNLVGRVAQSV
jgi:hypothetical protein